MLKHFASQILEGGRRVKGVTPNPREDSPVVSVITVCFNSSATLERTIRSVLSQTFSNVEYIIVDGGSQDGSIDVLRKYELDIDYFVSEPDAGIYYAMNKGISLSTGNLIGILNSDDWYEPSTLEEVVAVHKCAPRAVIYGLEREYQDGKEVLCITYDYRQLSSRMIPHPTCFVPRSIYEEHGVFDSRYRIAADYDLMARLFCRNVEFIQIDKVLANFTMGGMCDRSPAMSADEKTEIQFRHGFIDASTYRRRKLKNRFVKIGSLIRQTFAMK